MKPKVSWGAAWRTVAAGGALAAAAALAAGSAGAQIAQPPPPPPAEPQTARAAQPIDYTGYWVAVVTEDWQWRFVTPIVGDYTAVPLNAEGDQVARAWNNDADVAAGEQCKAFGAASINRLPSRLRIDWQDDETLKLEWDLGRQERLVHFASEVPPGSRSWQGHAMAEWVSVPAPGGRGGGRGGGGRGGAEPTERPGGLKVVTTNLRAQYLRMNGVPVSQNAVVTEYLDIVPAPDGQAWLIVKTIVEDPTYLSQPYIVSSHFRKEPDGSKWSPSECELFPRLRGTATQVPRTGG
jgi:hypothetical protein